MWGKESEKSKNQSFAFCVINLIIDNRGRRTSVQKHRILLNVKKLLFKFFLNYKILLSNQIQTNVCLLVLLTKILKDE